MTGLIPLRARDPRAAAPTTALILAVCAVVLAGFTVLRPPAAGAVTALSWLIVALLAAGAAVCRLVSADRLDRCGAFLLTPLVGTVLVCVLNVVTADTSAAAQAFLAFPVLWAGSHLRGAAVALVTGAAVAADAIALLLLTRLAAALTDLVFFGAVLVVMALMLARGGARHERLVTALREQARIDALTGLVNRWVFEEALTAPARPRSAGTALVLIDVDEFKTINDAHGHPVGDEALVHLAGVLRERVRAEDAVVARLGGDELAVLLPGCTPEVAVRRAEELLAAVGVEPLRLPDGTLLALSISVGVAHTPDASGDLRHLYSAADAALYTAKRSGRGLVAVTGAATDPPEGADHQYAG